MPDADPSRLKLRQEAMAAARGLLALFPLELPLLSSAGPQGPDGPAPVGMSLPMA
jgi:hypothetical protein